LLDALDDLSSYSATPAAVEAIPLRRASLLKDSNREIMPVKEGETARVFRLLKGAILQSEFSPGDS
jgi:hypothetical protein